jgi:hypothetical protein
MMVIGLEKDRRNEEKGQGHHEREIEESRADENQGAKAQRERA